MAFKKPGGKKSANKPQGARPQAPSAPKAPAPKPSAVKPMQPGRPQLPKNPAPQQNRPQNGAPRSPGSSSSPAPMGNKQPKDQNRPINPNAQREAAKLMRKKAKQNPKRKKFRGGNYTLYYVLGGIVLVIALIILSNTVFFRCTSINVSGNEKYTSDEIIAVSGIQKGDNLVKLDTSAARDNILNSLAYVDEVKVKKSFPTRINITVTEAEKQYCVVANGTTAAISRRGKILEICQADGLPIIRGYDPESLDVGTWLKSSTDGKSDIPGVILDAADKAGVEDITEIDMTDKFNVKVTVENRVILSLGPADEVESKMLVAAEIIYNQLGKDEYVTLQLSNPEKVPVQENSRPNTGRPSSSSSTASSGTSSAVSEPEDTGYGDEPGDPEAPEDPDEYDPYDPEDDGDPEEPYDLADNYDPEDSDNPDF